MTAAYLDDSLLIPPLFLTDSQSIIITLPPGRYAVALADTGIARFNGMAGRLSGSMNTRRLGSGGISRNSNSYEMPGLSSRSAGYLPWPLGDLKAARLPGP
jgi:hypothetical protein